MQLLNCKTALLVPQYTKKAGLNCISAAIDDTFIIVPPLPPRSVLIRSKDLIVPLTTASWKYKKECPLNARTHK